MPRNSSGVYTVPAGTFAATETDISSTAYNAFLADASAALTNSVNVQGTAPMLAAFNAGGFAMSNLGPGVAPTDAATLAQAQQAVPSGAVQFFAMATAPTGWVEANGASMSTTSFATLFAAIGFTFGGSGSSFNIPDLRGKFLRGWDHGAGIDSNSLAVAQITGFIAGTTLTVSSVIGGAVAIGQTMQATGGNVTTIGTTITAGSGTSWTVSISQTVGASGSPVPINLFLAGARIFGSFEPDLNVTHTHAATDSGHTHTTVAHSHTASSADAGHTHGVSDPGHQHTVSGVAAPSGTTLAQVGTINGSVGTSVATSVSGTNISLATGFASISTSIGSAAPNTNAGVAHVTNTVEGLSEVTVKNVALLPCIKT